MDAPRRQQVEALVAEALRAQDETGTAADLDALCRDHAELKESVARALHGAAHLERLQTSGLQGLPVLDGEQQQQRYRIDGRLGAGATGAVYSAMDSELRRRVAIKVLHPGILDIERAMARFERESEALAAVSEDAVVAVYDRGVTASGSPYFVMEYVDGVTLATILDYVSALPAGATKGTAFLRAEFEIEGLSEPSFLRQGVCWMAAVARALSAIHAVGIVHRDVKPSNIMIRRDGRAVMLDFGAVANAAHSRLTRTESAVGTPAYMAPESLDSRGVALAASDVYSTTATLYHIAASRPPYEGTPSQVLTAVATRDPVSLATRRSDVAKDLQAIVQRGMTREPRGRYASAAALEADLLAFLEHRTVSARWTSPLERGLRRAVRSTIVRAVAATLLVALAALGWRAWAAARAEDRAEAFQRAWPHLQASFGVVGYDNRTVADDELRETLRRTLDELVASGHRPGVAHALRAAFHLDYGDAAAAARDMGAVARHVDSGYARELARRYAVLPADASSAAELDLEGLPAPAGPMDHYLTGFHAMRKLQYADAEASLGDPGLLDVRHAQELRVLAQLEPIGGMSFNERYELAGSIYTQALEVEARFGSRSSMTAHLASFALLTREQHGEGLPIARQGMALAPTAYVTSINAARLAFRCGLYGEAEEWTAHSIRLVPNYWKAFETGLFTRLGRQQYAEAREWLARIPLSARMQRSWEVQIGTEEALHALRDGNPKVASAVALGTLEALGPARAALKGTDAIYASMCEAIGAEEVGALVQLLVERQVEDPLWPERLNTLIAHLPAASDETMHALLVQLLESISSALVRRYSDLALDR